MRKMKSIDVDSEVFATIQAAAEPLIDDANSTLRRLLGLEGEAPKGGHRMIDGSYRAPHGSLLPEEAYRPAILLELLARGGTGHAKEITDAVGERMASELTPKDLEQLKTGDIRWRNRVQFTRLAMKTDKLIAADTARGVWSLTPLGRGEAEKELAAEKAA
jgi:hypothetical protein